MLRDFYITDTLYFISRGQAPTKKLHEIMHPVPEDTRPADEIARERAAKLGLKVVV